MNGPTLEIRARRPHRVRRENRYFKQGGAVAGIIAFTAVLVAAPISALAAKRFNLLRLEESGAVIEINPSTHVIFNSLNDYLVSRLRGKVVEVEIEECRDEGLAVILIRYEEE